MPPILDLAVVPLPVSRRRFKGIPVNQVMPSGFSVTGPVSSGLLLQVGKRHSLRCTLYHKLYSL
jgi:hypothetical protein